MLVLLPPSEGKTPPPDDAAPVDFAALTHAAELTRIRRKVVAAVSPKLRRAPTAPAQDVYTGVLFGRLGLPELPHDDVLIFSGLWGLVAPDDRIPHYKLPIGERPAKLDRGLAALWRPAVAQALAARDVEDEVVVDLRSGGYVAVWKPKAAAHVAVRAFRVNPDGSRQVISHNAKVARGDVARAVLRSRKPIRTPQDVAAAAAKAGLDVELAGDGRAFTLDVLER